MFNAEFLYFDCPGTSHAHCASIAVAPDDSLVATWYVYPEDETSGARIVLAHKTGPDAKWTEAKPVALGTSSSLGNPLAFFDPDGTLWLHYVVLKGTYWDSAVWHASRSDNGGRTFSSATMMAKEEGLMVRHAPLLLDSGKALMPMYSDRTKESYIYEAQAPYTSWRRTKTFSNDPVIQPSLTQLGDRIVAFFRPSEEPRASWRSVSSDLGKTWSNPVRLPLPNPLSGIASIALNGKVGVVFNNTHEHQRYPLSISWSDSDLHEWSTPDDIDGSGFEVSYPSFIVDRHGIAHGVFTYNRKFIKYVTFDTRWMKEQHASH